MTLNRQQSRQLVLLVALSSFLAMVMVWTGQFDVGIGAREALHYDRELRSWTLPVAVPNLGWAAFLVLTPALVFVSRVADRPAGALAYSLAVLCGLVGLTETIEWTGAPDQTAEALYVIPYALFLGILGWRLRAGAPASAPRKLWVALALAGVLAWGLGVRLEELAWAANSPPSPDASYYRQMAQAMNGPYDTAFREPLWVWSAKGWFGLVDDSDISLRVLTIALSVGLIGVAYKLFRDYTGQAAVGLLVAVLLSQHAYMIG